MDNTTAQFARTYYTLLKTNKTKYRHRIRIYELVSAELSGFTILLLVIPKFFDSIANFLKRCTQQTAANYPACL